MLSAKFYITKNFLAKILPHMVVKHQIATDTFLNTKILNHNCISKTFADWGVDMLKLDGCNSKVTDMKTGYPQMTQYLNKTGRPIIFSCSWPDYERASGMQVNDNTTILYIK